ncbi:divergent polysaccharide deacetylase family protein [Candidatus Neomarinimicrobiota bacterium]
MTKSTHKNQSFIFKLIFIILIFAAAGFIASQLFSSGKSARVQRQETLVLKEGLISEFEGMGLYRQALLGEHNSIRFSYPPTMSSDDLMLMLKRIMQHYDLILTAAVKYETQRELYVEMSTREQQAIARFTFMPRIDTDGHEGGVRGRIALIIDDFGYIHNQLTDAFMDLGAALTISVIPGHRFSILLAEEALTAGFEVMIHMPLEPENYNGRDEAQYMLTFGMQQQEIKERIRLAFQGLPMAVGLNNHEGSLAMLDTVLLEVLAEELRNRNKYFVDSYTTPDTRGIEIMERYGVRTLGRKIFIDNEDDPEYITRQLAYLAEKAEKDGSAIGIGHVGSSHLHTIDVLEREIPFLISKGFEFVFVSELMNETEVIPNEGIDNLETR